MTALDHSQTPLRTWEHKENNEHPSKFWEGQLEETIYLMDCGFMAKEAYQNNEREAFLLQVVWTFLQEWPVVWVDGETMLRYRERIKIRASEAAWLVRYSALDRTPLLPPDSWRIWARWTPQQLREKVETFRERHEYAMTLRGAPAYVSTLCFACLLNFWLIIITKPLYSRNNPDRDLEYACSISEYGQLLSEEDEKELGSGDQGNDESESGSDSNDGNESGNEYDVAM